MARKVAFFDIDGTLFRSSLLIELVERFIEAGVFPKEARERYQVSHTNWLNRASGYELYIGDVITTFLEYMRGVHYGVFADVGREVVRDHGRKVYRYTRDLIATLRDQHYFLVAISQSPKTILDEFCAEYGFDKVYGRMYEIDAAGLFTGAVLEEKLIENKAAIASRVFEKEGVTTEGSIGVGDTEGDIPLLQRVETPICFNPNAGLYAHAQSSGWKVVVERKDVIYEL